jgi:hypothetical protein
MEPGGTPFPLTVLKGGINRLRIKGGADPSSLYDLVNAFINLSGGVQPRDGTIRVEALDDTTAGLVYFDGEYQIFSSSLDATTPPTGFNLNILVNPSASGAVTISEAAPAVITWQAHGLIANAPVIFSVSTGGALPTGLTAAVTYYVLAAGLTANTFEVSATPGGTPITTTSAGSGTFAATSYGGTDPISIIWFAQPFMGFIYVAAEFQSGTVAHYWLQSQGVWQADTVYTTGAIITPTLPNATGLAYQAVRLLPPNPTWAPEVATSEGALVEPTVPNGYYFTATNVEGTNPHTGETEPTWPAATGATVQDFGDYAVASNTSLTSSPGAATPLSQSITDRYGDSADISGEAAANSSTLGAVTVLPTAGNSVSTWRNGTIYPQGSVVIPTSNQGAVVNAIPNGDFADGDDGSWDFSGTGTQWQITTSQGFAPGTGSAFISPGSTSAFLTMDQSALVNPGQSVTVTAMMKTGTSGPTDLIISLGINWYSDVDGTVLISSSDGGGKSSGGGWIMMTTTASAPATAKSAKAYFHAASGTSDRDTGRVSNVAWNLETPSATTQLLFEAIQTGAGTSGATQPTWPDTIGATVDDGTVVWQAIGSSIITWTASPIMESGDTEPTWPTVVGEQVSDGIMSWVAVSRQITDPNCPNTPIVALGASHVFAGDLDIVPFSAAVNPTDWTSANNAGYLPTGLNNYGANPVAVLTLYRGNLIAMNAGGYQMWQIDPDPASMAILDAQPVGSSFTRGSQSVANDTLVTTILGLRNIGTTGATANLQTGMLGQPIDQLVRAAIVANTNPVYPLSLYYPSRGQMWLIFGDQAFVLTVNGNQQKSWSRYTFPDSLTDWTLNGETLVLRTLGNLVWQVDPNTLVDDVHTVPNGITISNQQATGPEQAIDGVGTVAACATFGIEREGFPSADFGSFTGEIGFGTVLVCCTAVDGFSNGDFYFVVDGGEAGAPAQNAFTSISYVSPRDSDTYTWDTSAATFTQNGTQSCWAWDLGSHFTGSFGSTLGASIPVTFVGGGGGTGFTEFTGLMQWPYLDLSRFGLNKEMVGFDIVGNGEVTIQVGFDETDLTTLDDNPGFSTSMGVTPPYTLDAADTLPGQPIGFPLNAPSYSVILTWPGNQAWSWQAFQIYAQTQASAG